MQALTEHGRPITDIAADLQREVDRSSPTESYHPFPVRLLPEPLATFAEETATSIGTDSAMTALPLLAAVAGSIGNARTIEVKPGWTEPAVAWAMPIAPPSERKTPSLDAALAPLRRLQDLEFAAYREKLARFEEAQARYEEAIREWRQKHGPEPEKPEEPTPVRYMVSDVTVEALAERLEQNPRGLLLARDELAGLVKDFDKYRKGSDAQSFCSMHRAGPITVDRKARKGPLHVPRAALSITGTIQPGTLARVFTAEMRESGLLARFLLAWPPPQPRIWTDAEVSSSVNAEVHALFEKLVSLPTEHDPGGGLVPKVLKVNPEAKKLFIQFFGRIGRAQGGASEDLASVLGKLEGTAARFALIFHVVRSLSQAPDLGDPDVVDAVSMGSGIKLAIWFAGEAARVYAVLDREEQRVNLASRTEFIRSRGGTMSLRDYGRSKGIKSPEALTELQALAQAGLGEIQKSTPGPGGGRPSTQFILRDSSDICQNRQNLTKPPAEPSSGGGLSVSSVLASVSNDAEHEGTDVEAGLDLAWRGDPEEARP